MPWLTKLPTHWKYRQLIYKVNSFIFIRGMYLGRDDLQVLDQSGHRKDVYEEHAGELLGETGGY